MIRRRRQGPLRRRREARRTQQNQERLNEIVKSLDDIERQKVPQQRQPS